MNLKHLKTVFLKDKNTGMNLKALLFSFGLLSSLYGRCQTSMSAGADRLLNYIEQHIPEIFSTEWVTIACVVAHPLSKRRFNR
jgi:hypothetical protein